MARVPTKREREWLPFSSIFDNFFNRFLEEDQIQETERMMAVDLIEKENEYVVKANLPGIKKEDVNVSLHENELIIEAKQDEEREEKTETMYRSERYRGDYRRVIYLTDTTDADNIKGEMKDGVLTLSIPKKEPKPKKQIKIQ